MRTDQLVLAAMKEKAPQLLAQLKESGSLDQYIQTLAEDISSEITTLSLQIAIKHGYNDPDKTLPERVAIHNGAIPLAREIVLAELLDFPQDSPEQEPSESWTGVPDELFPQDGTSPQRRVAITTSRKPT